jgi:hypothetical protein
MLMSIADDIITKYETPFKTVIVILPGEDLTVPGGFIPAIRLSEGTGESFRKEFTSISTLTENFIVCLEEPYPDEVLSELLVHALFSTNYLFINQKPVVLFGKDLPRTAVENLHQQLNVLLASQGFQGLIMWRNGTEEQGDIEEEYGTEVQNSCESGKPAFIYAYTRVNNDWMKTHLFRDLNSLTGNFIFDFDDKAEAIGKQQFLDNACKSFLAEQPVLSNSLNDYLSLKKSVAKLSSEHKEMSERFSGAEKTIGVIRTKYKDDYENLFKWYHNEYEILPLWYKRFGHILKVFMGRRSFRSLFSEDVKKYKN